MRFMRTPVYIIGKMTLEHILTNPELPKKIPKTKMCYICYMEFWPKSLSIHEAQCLEKWRLENDKRPENKRFREPKKPEIILTSEGRIDIKATNEAAWKQIQKNMVPCTHCGRTFKHDRLEVHNRICTEEKPCKGIQKSNCSKIY
uniref:Zinc finger protein 474 (inferred by orthology to a human protein) n=1 Tax=Strongyloides venezuelensis TaxID=75913 RepID=A0A0K0F315_STRVS